MGLRELAKLAAATAFKAAGNIPTAAVYRSKTFASGVYNAATGTVTDSFIDMPVDMIFTSFKAEEIDGSTIRLSDMKGIVLAEALAVAPKANDLVVKGGATHEVIGIKSDPAEAAWVLHLRKP